MKSRLLGAVCASLFAFCLPTSTHAAILTTADTSGNGVTDSSSPAFVNVTIDFVNLDPVWLFYDPVGEPFENMSFRINNSTGFDWTDFHIEYVDSDPFAPIFLDFPVIAPDTDPGFFLDVGVNENTGLPDAGWIFFNTPESSGLSISAFADRSLSPFSQFSIHLQPTVIPVPAAVWLFGSGLLGLVGIARRKQAA